MSVVVYVVYGQFFFYDVNAQHKMQRPVLQWIGLNFENYLQFYIILPDQLQYDKGQHEQKQ